MTTNLHDKMLAAIDAYFSASDAVEEEVAENLLLDVRDEINKYKRAAESLNEGLRLDDWDKIGCVNHDCDKCKALAEQPAQQEPVAWMQDSIELYVQDRPSATYTIPLYTSPQAQQEPVYRCRPYSNVPGAKVSAPVDYFTIPQAQPAREPLTDEKYEAIVEDLAGWGCYVEGDRARQSLEKHVREVLTAHGITKENT